MAAVRNRDPDGTSIAQGMLAPIAGAYGRDSDM
jgi:hypothetical protein